MAKNKYVIVDAILEYAKVFEQNRDMGNDKVDLSETDGEYKVHILVDDANMQKMLDAGVPAKQGAFAQFHKKEFEGQTLNMFRAKRAHKHKHFKAYDADGNLTNEPLVLGEPVVFDYNDFISKQADNIGKKPHEYITKLTIEDGLIGNGTKAKVKLRVENGTSGKGKAFTKVQLESVGITDLVVYEGAGDFF